VLVMLSFLTLPRAATDLDLDSDASLGEVLGYAHQQGLQFGTDFVKFLTMMKRHEISRFLSEVTDWEMREYFEFY